jgi:hypothetical protein
VFRFGSEFDVRGSRFERAPAGGERGTTKREPSTEREHELSSENWEA